MKNWTPGKLALALAAIVSTVVVYILIDDFGGGGGQAQSPIPVMINRALAAAPAASVLNTQGIARTASSPSLPKPDPSLSPTKFSEGFVRTDNYRAYIHEALADPKNGGHFYALTAYTKCRQLSNMQVEQSAGDAPQVTEAKLKLIKEIGRCEGVIQQYGEDSVPFYRLILDQRKGVDPLLPHGGRGVIKPASQIMAESDLVQAKSTGDRYAVAAVLQSNVEFLAPKFLGNDFAPEREQIYNAAAGVVACELRQDCDSVFLNAGRCAFRSDCRYGDYRDFVLSTFKADEQKHYSMAVKRMQQAVAGRQ